MKRISRFKEFTCVLFGHQWDSHGSTSNENGDVLEEFYECTHCRLRNHDSSGYLMAFKRSDASLAAQRRYEAATSRPEFDNSYTVWKPMRDRDNGRVY